MSSTSSAEAEYSRFGAPLATPCSGKGGCGASPAPPPSHCSKRRRCEPEWLSERLARPVMAEQVAQEPQALPGSATPAASAAPPSASSGSQSSVRATAAQPGAAARPRVARRLQLEVGAPPGPPRPTPLQLPSSPGPSSARSSADGLAAALCWDELWARSSAPLARAPGTAGTGSGSPGWHPRIAVHAAGAGTQLLAQQASGVCAQPQPAGDQLAPSMDPPAATAAATAAAAEETPAAALPHAAGSALLLHRLYRQDMRLLHALLLQERPDTGRLLSRREHSS